jgi:signal transduction histidine kinase
MKVSEVQADFLDRISHELRTPLATISLVSDLLQNERTEWTPAEKKLWSAHRGELERLKTDVELLLQAARLRESRFRVEHEPIRLSEFFENKFDSFKSLLGPHGRLSFTGEVLDRPVELDPSLLELIFRNLLDNARKFAKDYPVVEVQFKKSPARIFFRKTQWQIQVRDFGMGFAPEDSTELFKRFTRIESSQSTERSVPGTGLGLYLCASAAKAMGLKLKGQGMGTGSGALFTIEGNYQ